MQEDTNLEAIEMLTILKMPLVRVGSILLWLAPLALSPPAAYAQNVPALTKPGNSFWSTDAATGTVYFEGHTHLANEPAEGYAQHVRQWLTTTSEDWSERNSGDPTKLLFSAQMRGVHPTVALRYQVSIKLEQGGFLYILTNFRVGAPSGQGTMFWHDLHRLLEDPDFRADIVALPSRTATGVTQPVNRLQIRDRSSVTND